MENMKQKYKTIIIFVIIFGIIIWNIFTITYIINNPNPINCDKKLTSFIYECWSVGEGNPIPNRIFVALPIFAGFSIILLLILNIPYKIWIGS